MAWQELERELEQGRVAPVYLFYGEEGYLLELALRKLQARLIPPEVAAFDYQELDGREMAAAQVVLLADTLPALAPKRLVVIKDPSPEILKDSGGDLQAYLAQPAATTCLVLVFPGNIDKRLKLVKIIQQAGQVVEFSPLKGSELEKWLQGETSQEGYTLQPAAARLLARASAGDLRQARNELAKVMTYLGAPGTITAAAVQALVPAADAEATIFQLVDALGNRDATLAINTLRRLLARGEAPLGIVAMLARQVRLIYQYHLAADQGELATRLRLKPFVLQKVAAQARHFSLPAAGRALAELLLVDTGLKTGQGSPGLLLEEAIWHITGEH
ncbi:MAG: polymerase subunit delta [Clostridia bacterium]|nr:polymerase subunit delta [Clostridia bacterium]